MWGARLHSSSFVPVFWFRLSMRFLGAGRFILLSLVLFVFSPPGLPLRQPLAVVVCPINPYRILNSPAACVPHRLSAKGGDSRPRARALVIMMGYSPRSSSLMPTLNTELLGVQTCVVDTLFAVCRSNSGQDDTWRESHGQQSRSSRTRS